jgi:hypothetical protein
MALEATARSLNYCLNGFKDEASDRHMSLDWYKSDLPIHPALLAMRVRSRSNALAWLREPCCKKSALSLSKTQSWSDLDVSFVLSCQTRVAVSLLKCTLMEAEHFERTVAVGIIWRRNKDKTGC